jgi:hypothetical protein
MEAEQAAELNAALDAAEGDAAKAREIGEKILKSDYTKQAKALAATLAKLEAIDTFIADKERLLHRAGREGGLPNSNACRHVLPITTTETVAKRVKITDPRHPYYGQVDVPAMFDEFTPNPTLRLRDDPSKTTTYSVEVQVEEQHTSPPHWAVPLYEVCTVPAVEALAPPLWADTRGHTVPDAEHDRRIADRARILAELGIVPAKANA